MKEFRIHRSRVAGVPFREEAPAPVVEETKVEAAPAAEEAAVVEKKAPARKKASKKGE